MDAGLSLAPHPPELKVQANRGRPENKEKTPSTINGMTLDGRYFVYNNNTRGLLRGIKERVFFFKNGETFVRPVRPESQALFNNRLSEFKRLIGKEARKTEPMSGVDFVNTYRGRKRTIYQKALESLAVTSINQGDFVVSPFVKTEKTLPKAGGLPAPRIIHPYNTRYNLALGVYIKKIEKRIFRIIGKIYKGVTVFKGLNAEERGAAMVSAWGKFTRPVAVGLDASKWDEHFTKIAHLWTHNIYKKFFPKIKELDLLLKQQLSNKCRAFTSDSKITYITDMLMSGVPNTALGNCLLMCALVWSYCQEKGIVMRLLNDGDDCVAVMESTDLNAFMEGLSEWFEQMGFNMKVEEPVYNLEEIEFCQSHPIYDGTKHIMVRSPNPNMSKDCFILKNTDTAAAFQKWIATVGEGGMNLTGGIPVWQNFYRCMLRNSGGAKSITGDPLLDSGFFMLGRRMNRLFIEPTDLCRVSFYDAFGIDPAQQLAIEAYYDHLDLSPTHDGITAIQPLDLASLVVN